MVGVEIDLHSFLAPVLGDWSTSRLGRFTPGERTAGAYWTGGRVGPSAGLDFTDKRNFFVPTAVSGLTMTFVLRHEVVSCSAFYKLQFVVSYFLLCGL